MFTILTTNNVTNFLNTGNELTAQCVSSDSEELYFGVGQGAYLERREATAFFYKVEDQSSMYTPGLNPLYVHLTTEGLAYLLDNNEFVVTSDED